MLCSWYEYSALLFVPYGTNKGELFAHRGAQYYTLEEKAISKTFFTFAYKGNRNDLV